MNSATQYSPLSKARFSQLRKLSQKKFRSIERQYLIEGVHLVQEALASGDRIQEILLTQAFLAHKEAESLSKLWKERRILVSLISDKELEDLAETVSAQGILAVVHSRIAVLDGFLNAPQDGIVVALDSVSDPGNLGTIIRTCDWFGVKALLVGRGSVDLHNAKVIRATQGSLFHLNIFEDLDLPETLVAFRRHGYSLWGTTLEDADPVNSLAVPNRCVVVFGSEADGLSHSVSAACDRFVTIPSFGKAESLNVSVAAGVVLAGMRLYKPTDRARSAPGSQSGSASGITGGTTSGLRR